MAMADESRASESAQVVLDTFRAVEERDRDRLLDLYHPDVEFVWPLSLPYGGTYRGRDLLTPRVMSWEHTWDPLQPTAAERRMDPQVVAVADNDVVVLYHQRGVNAAGRRFDQEVLGYYRADGGKFLGAKMFHFDTAALVSFLADR
jgi:ketosteroid isomerase-like protein